MHPAILRGANASECEEGGRAGLPRHLYPPWLVSRDENSIHRRKGSENQEVCLAWGLLSTSDLLRVSQNTARLL